jgi:16S rRNA processing protein RimM
LSTTDSESSSGRPALLEVGRVARPHGLDGEVVVDLVTDRTERLCSGSVLATPAGAELVVRDARPFGERWLVNFEGVTDRSAAERIRGLALLAPPIEDEDTLWIDELVGSSVADKDGKHLGTVSAVVANPASDLLELEDGGLIPLVFVVSRSEQSIVVDVPEGLLE